MAQQTYPRENKCKRCGAHIGWILGPEGELFALPLCDDCPPRRVWWKAVYVGTDEALNRADELLVEMTNQLSREFPNVEVDMDVDWTEDESAEGD